MTRDQGERVSKKVLAEVRGCLDDRQTLPVEGAIVMLRGVAAPMLGPLPIVTSASLVSVSNPHLCAYILEYSCASSVCVF